MYIRSFVYVGVNQKHIFVRKVTNAHTYINSFTNRQVDYLHKIDISQYEIFIT